jgi:photosystem II stability/assembly factor-like uncharacterized protein
MQESGTTAGLRGIDSVDGTVAWASGTGGTVLKTIDGGAHWTKCAVPDAAKDGSTLDFRGVQAWDADTAIVMASGPGEKSRLYKTTDGCKTWKLLFTNPDPDGFWNAIAANRKAGLLIGDPVGGRFAIFSSTEGGLEKWERFGELSDFAHFRFEPSPYEGEGLFAASNSNMKGVPTTGIAFVTGGPRGAFFAYGVWRSQGSSGYPEAGFAKIRLPLAEGKTAGASSFSCAEKKFSHQALNCITVGGDYLLPDSPQGTAAYSSDNGKKWKAPRTSPHGYRSAVQWSESLRAWIAVGTNGSDVSRDDGKTWQPLDDGNWNALLLPFVVGPNGRIAQINPAALSGTK